jgi:hypothetical protein
MSVVGGMERGGNSGSEGRVENEGEKDHRGSSQFF